MIQEGACNMNINSIYRNITSATTSKSFEKFKSDIEKADAESKSNSASDVVDFSAEALKFKEKLASGDVSDAYSVEKSSDGSFSVRFSNSSQVAKAVTDGYINIDGKKIELSKADKKELVKTDKLAQKEREKAYARAVIEHDIEVMKKQNESSVSALLEDQNDVFGTAMKIFEGEEVSQDSLNTLKEFNSELYTIAKLTSVLAKQETQINQMKLSGLMSDESGAINNTIAQNEWQRFSAEISVSFKDGEAQISDIFVGEK